MTLYSSSCLSETDIMACAACKIMKKRCTDNCPFADFFGPQDTERFLTIRALYTVQEMRNLLRDANTTREDKKQRLQEWYAEAANALVAAQILLDLKNGNG